MISRREFLKSAAMTTAGVMTTGLPLNSLAKDNDHFFLVSGEAPGPFFSKQSIEEILAEIHHLHAVNLYTGVHFKFPVPIPAHSVVPHPVNSNQLISLPLRKPLGFLIDLYNPKKVVRFNAIENHDLDGHGAFTADGNFFITSEQSKEKAQGVLVVRRADTLKVEEKFESFGHGPHEVKVINNMLIVANGDEGQGKNGSSLVQIDLKSGKKISALVPPDSNLVFRHLHVLSKNKVLIAPLRILSMSTPPHQRPPLPLLADFETGKVTPFSAPDWIKQRMLSFQLLSLAVDEKSNLLITTCPSENSVLTWNIKDLSFLEAHQLKGASGVVNLPGSKLFVTLSSDPAIEALIHNSSDKNRAKFFGKKTQPIVAMTGSHSACVKFNRVELS